MDQNLPITTHESDLLSLFPERSAKMIDVSENATVDWSVFASYWRAQ